MSTLNKVSNFTKFKILLYKDLKLQYNKPIRLGVLLAAAIISPAILLICRFLNPPKVQEAKTFPPIEIEYLPTEIDSLEFKILYTPKNDMYERYVDYVVTKLTLGGFDSCNDTDQFERELLKNDYLVGIRFINESDSEKFAFELRFPAKNGTKKNLNWHTDKLTPNLLDEAYIKEGFLNLQFTIVKTHLYFSTDTEFDFHKFNESMSPNIIVQRFPEAEKKIYNFRYYPWIIVFSIIYVVINIPLNMAEERANEMKEIMVINGLHYWLHWLAWFATAFIIMVLITCIVVIITKIFGKNAVFPESSFTALLFLLIISTIPIIYAGFLSSWLNKIFYIEIVMILVALLIMLLVYLVESFALKIVICLLPFMTFILSINYVFMLEEQIIGLQWSDFYKTYDTSMVPPLICLIMDFVDTILYCLLCLYLEQVNPGKFGIPRKWNFPFQRSFWQRKKKDTRNGRSPGGAIQDGTETTSKRENVNDDSIGVRVQHLTKKFDDYVAVNDLSFDIYFNEITVLLGRNGAGKSTFIFTLSGLYPPTSGTAFVKGYDICHELSSARKYLSVCPQSNAIFADLNVKDNIKFFCTARGVQDPKAEIEKYLKITELEEEKKVLAKDLSRGMKRKLSLCCALCGSSSQIVLCDEPSSGVDPAVRRHLWSLLQAEKKGKAILLTTHYMDEAEALADRIIIIKEGEAKFEGTIYDMQKQFGRGYCLVCDMREDCLIEEVTQFLKTHIPIIYLESVRGSVLTYRLPSDDSSRYGSVFRDLENNLDRLRLTGFGVSISTVEDGFMQIASGKERKSGKRNFPFLNSWRNFNIFSDRLLIEKKRSRKLQQIKGLLLKRKLLTNWYLELLFIIIPVIILWSTLSGKIKDLQPLPIDIRRYDEGIVVLEEPEDAEEDSYEMDIVENFEEYSTSFGTSYTFEENSVEDFVNGSGQQTIEKILVGATVESYPDIKVWLNMIHMHTAPLSLNFMLNALVRTHLGPNASVEVTNAPLPFKTENMDEYKTSINIMKYIIVVVIFLKIFKMPIMERVYGTEHQQLLNGIDIGSYWLINLAMDFINLWLILIAMLLVYTFGCQLGFYGFMVHLIIFTIFTLAILLKIYALYSLCWNIVAGTTVLIVMFALIISFGGSKVTGVYLLILPLLPFLSFVTALHNLASNIALRDLCKKMIEEKGLTCSVIESCCEIEDYFSFKYRGASLELIFLLISIILFLFLLILTESPLCSRKGTPESTKDPVDNDVAKEQKFIKNLWNDELDRLPLVVNSISKKYGFTPAVRNLSFHVTYFDIFGLLGANGAGKTTTLNMLTGQERIGSGKVYHYGESIGTQFRKSTLQIGYCPQQNVLFNKLTGRQNLRIFCLLRGVRTSEIRKLSNVLALKFNFTEHMDKPAKNWSGGNKRKLCFAIALIGNPKVIYLDEPSNGMDPIARRHLWDIITDLRELGKPIILTSHNMEECEALCTRLAIMKKGVFICLGSTQHLKNKFAKIFVLKIKVKSNLKSQGTSNTPSKENSTSQDVKNNIKAFISNKFPYTKLVEEYENTLNFQIPMKDTKWSEIFDFMELNRNRLYIDDYTICQVTLDDIFVEHIYNNN